MNEIVIVVVEEEPIDSAALVMEYVLALVILGWLARGGLRGS